MLRFAFSMLYLTADRLKRNIRCHLLLQNENILIASTTVSNRTLVSLL